MVWNNGYKEEDENESDLQFWPNNDPDQGTVTNKGEFIQGTVNTVKKGKYGLFMVIEYQEGNAFCTPQAKQLIKQIRRLKIEPEDIVHLTYLGEGKQPDDPTYSPAKLFKLQKWEDDVVDDED